MLIRELTFVELRWTKARSEFWTQKLQRQPAFCKNLELIKYTERQKKLL